MRRYLTTQATSAVSGYNTTAPIEFRLAGAFDLLTGRRMKRTKTEKTCRLAGNFKDIDVVWEQVL